LINKATLKGVEKMKEKLLQIIESHQSLDNKLHLMDDVESMFEQIRLIRQENRGLTMQLSEIKKIVKE
jgi:hypothetical protein